MSEQQRIAIVGAGTFARSVAEAVRQSPDAALVGQIGPSQPFPTSANLVLCLEEPGERVGVVKNAVAAGFPVVTLPLPDGGRSVRMVVQAGSVVQVSPLLGFGAITEMLWQAREGALGQPYGVFASYRVSQPVADPFGDLGVSLLAVVADLLDGPIARAQVTKAALHGKDPDAWFVIAKTQSGLIATIEFGRLLSTNSSLEQQLIVEATGSERVLRAEPTRQAVTIKMSNGRTRESGWWAPLATGFFQSVLSAVKQPDSAREDRLLSLVAAVRQAEKSGQPVTTG